MPLSALKERMLDAVASIGNGTSKDCTDIMIYVERLEDELKKANVIKDLAEKEVDAMEKRIDHLFNNMKELYFVDFYNN